MFYLYSCGVTLHFPRVLYFSCCVAFTFRVCFSFLLWGCLHFSCVFYISVWHYLYIMSYWFSVIYFTRAIYISRSIYISWYYVCLSRCDAQIFHVPQFYAVMLLKYFKKLVLRRQSYYAGHGAGMGLSEFFNGDGFCSEQGVWWWIRRSDHALVSLEMQFREGQRGLLF